VKKRTPRLVLTTLLCVVALAAAACGSDKSSNEAGSPAKTTSTAAGGTSVEGCGERASTDPADTSVGRKVARCDPGAPAPKPLPQMTTIRVASAFRLEFNSPLLLADTLGELQKENLKMDFINLKFSDAVPQLANGSVDVAVGGIEVALFNAGHAGLPVKATLANYFPPHAGDYKVAQTGLWCRRDAFTTPDKPKLKEIEKLKLASSVGAGSVSFYYTTQEIIRQGVKDFSLKGANIQSIPSVDTVPALENKAIDCGIILDPLWTQLANNPKYFLAASQTPGEPLGIYAYGKRLLVDHPEIGDAFARAYIRTVNTYYDGNYHANPKVMAEIAKVTAQPVAALTKVDSLVMDWEFRKGTTTRVQQYLIDVGVITGYDTPVAENKVVDRSFYERAVGAA
jgi:NitT/TauT family transport system substrate-binding protein